jgi:RNA polymerase sigma-70 factor (ECF subfamily)
MHNNTTTNSFIKRITENQGIIHKICNIYCANSEDKKDMMQEITLQLWKSYPSFQGKSKFSTWMYRIAINTAISNIRKSKRHPLMEALFESQIEISEKEDFTEMDDDVNNLYKAIAKLKEVDRAIIMLYLEEKSYNEIAEIIGITEKNVSVKLVRLKKKLEQLLTCETE